MSITQLFFPFFGGRVGSSRLDVNNSAFLFLSPVPFFGGRVGSSRLDVNNSAFLSLFWWKGG